MVWIPYRDPVDFVLIEGQPTPGIAIVEKAGIVVQWDKIRGYGYGGAVSRFTGLDLSEFNVRYELWEDADWQDHENFMPVVAKPPRGIRPKAKSIWHPFLEALDIKSVTIKGVSQPHPVKDGTVYEVVINCLQFGKPRTMYGQPEGAQDKSNRDWAEQLLYESREELNRVRFQELAGPTMGEIVAQAVQGG